jgi:hypothetical protein
MVIETKHYIKTWPKFFEQTMLGLKTCEFRQDDRNYCVCDDLVLQEYDPQTKKYTGREIDAIVSHVLHTQDCIKVPAGYCVMSIKVTNYRYNPKME